MSPHSLQTELSADNWICGVQYGIVCKKGGQAKAPPSIDPMALAQAQAQANIQTAQAQAKINNSNTFSPLGSTIWTLDPNTGQYTLNQNLSPQTQALLNSQIGNIGSVLGGTGANIGLATNPSAIQSTVPTDFASQIRQAQDAAYNANTMYLNPQYAQQRSDLTQQLADQGINPNNAAYTRATGDLARNQQLGYNAAQAAAVAAGNQEQNTLFGQMLSAGQFANSAQAQRMAQILQSLGIPTNLSWASSLPTFGGQNTTVPATNVVGAAQVAAQNAANQFNANNTLNNQFFNGLGSLGSVLGSNNFLGTGSSLAGLLGLGGAGATAATAGAAAIPAISEIAAIPFL